ncbi:MAG: hypothetical protein HEP71_27545 [Roseivirga sp.]|nr:hypothetical protein [Roseivirga sp.]
MRTCYLLLGLFLTYSLPAQYMDLAQLGLKGKVETIMEKVEGQTKYDLFRAFYENGNIQGKRKNIWEGKLLNVIITIYQYDDDGKLILSRIEKNDEIIGLSEYVHSGDTLIETRKTNEKTELLKRYFDQQKRQQIIIRNKSTITTTLDEDYLPVKHVISFAQGEMVTHYQTKVIKRDDHGNWLEVEIRNKHIATKKEVKTVWKREIDYYQ